MQWENSSSIVKKTKRRAHGERWRPEAEGGRPEWEGKR